MLRSVFLSISNRINKNTRRNTMPLLDRPQTDTNSSTIPYVQIDQPSSTPLNGTPIVDYDQYLRAKLRFFLMSPCWKWRLKRQCPWKAWFQFLKIIFLTAQLILFGIERQAHVIFIAESNITFHHLFVREWNTAYETLPYPRAAGDFALYTQQEMLDSINYAVHRFNNLTDISLGLFDFKDHSNSTLPTRTDVMVDAHHVQLCLNRFKSCAIDPSSHTYILDIQAEDKCFKFNASDKFDVEQYLFNTHNETINYCSLNMLTLEFVIHAIQLKNQRPFSIPDCYHFRVKVSFDNNPRAGKIRQHLNSDGQFRTCNRRIIDQGKGWTFVRRDLLITFDFIIIVITIISFILCLRSLWHGHQLCLEVRRYYASHRSDEKPLSWTDIKVFYSYWYILMVITDLMVLPGSVIKINILFKVIDQYDTAGLLLGLSSLFSWICILRYLSFFEKYNLLFVTVTKALPILLRFLSCALIIYCGFMFCGWIVLGPYHTKFRTISTTSETLFGLINGDDMYVTFANIETESFYIWLFSEIYLYSFICFFIFVITSLIIGLLIDAYDLVKTYYTEGFPKHRMQLFSEEDLPASPARSLWQNFVSADEARYVCLPCFCRRPHDLNELAARDPYLVQHRDTFI